MCEGHITESTLQSRALFKLPIVRHLCQMKNKNGFESNCQTACRTDCHHIVSMTRLVEQSQRMRDKMQKNLPGHLTTF